VHFIVNEGEFRGSVRVVMDRMGGQSSVESVF
jgi:hypothetical protein